MRCFLPRFDLSSLIICLIGGLNGTSAWAHCTVSSIHSTVSWGGQGRYQPSAEGPWWEARVRLCNFSAEKDSSLTEAGDTGTGGGGIGIGIESELRAELERLKEKLSLIEVPEARNNESSQRESFVDDEDQMESLEEEKERELLTSKKEEFLERMEELASEVFVLVQRLKRATSMDR